MNTVELLMKLDAGKVAETPTKTIEIKRLSDIAGEPFLVEVGGLSGRRYTEIVGMSADKNGINYGRLFDTHVMAAVEGIRNIDLKDKELQKHYGAATPKELVEKIFHSGEIVRISDLVTELSGYGKDVDREIKN